MSANLLRKDNKEKLFLCSEPQRLYHPFLRFMEELGCSFPLKRNNKCLEFHLENLDRPDFWINTGQKSQWALASMWDRRSLVRNVPGFVWWHVITYLIFHYFIYCEQEKWGLVLIWFKKPNQTVLDWVRKFSEPWEMTSKVAKKPNKNEKWHAVISRRLLERSASDAFYFALLLMAWKEDVNLLWQL